MIINCKQDPLSKETSEMMGGRCFVDGVEIKLVWYADTDAGIAKTYDVFHDGKVHAVADMPPHDFSLEGLNVDAPPNGAFSQTLRGRVELLKPIEAV